ncbi:MAG: hypothetical protein KAT70_03010, partial [Thermoplasmata archaeon]|nr:hypothetical protein [Thermoplasmata archaeon]
RIEASLMNIESWFHGGAGGVQNIILDLKDGAIKRDFEEIKDYGRGLIGEILSRMSLVRDKGDRSLLSFQIDLMSQYLHLFEKFFARFIQKAKEHPEIFQRDRGELGKVVATYDHIIKDFETLFVDHSANLQGRHPTFENMSRHLPKTKAIVQ